MSDKQRATVRSVQPKGDKFVATVYGYNEDGKRDTYELTGGTAKQALTKGDTLVERLNKDL